MKEIRSGDKFGGFTVIEEIDRLPSQPGTRMFKVLCNNGFEHRLRSYTLTANRECKAAGCVRKARHARMTKILAYVLTKKYGNWQPVRLFKRKITTGHSLFECLCDCGEKRIISLHLLRCPSSRPNCKKVVSPSDRYRRRKQREEWKFKERHYESPGDRAVRWIEYEKELNK